MGKVFGDLVPTLCVGTPSGALRPGQRTEQDAKHPVCIPTQSVGTRMCVNFPSTEYQSSKVQERKN
ncbi:hypothetical protein QUF90_04475 [Desulfococcaceae bacterium HSG9]|nr:hypothetical protein [Desulfococcaceae bacterium HSG9]